MHTGPLNTLAAVFSATLLLMLLPRVSPFRRSPIKKSEGLPYEVEIQGKDLDKSPVSKLLPEVSLAVQKKDDPPKSPALLRRRCEGDIPEMQKVLRSFGIFEEP